MCVLKNVLDCTMSRKVQRLTWAGHVLLDNAGNDTV